MGFICLILCWFEVWIGVGFRLVFFLWWFYFFLFVDLIIMFSIYVMEELLVGGLVIL